MRSQLVQLAGHCVGRSWRRPHWRILYYHAIPRASAGRFDEQLAWFSERFHWCTLSEGVEALAAGTIDRPLLSLTFDDGDRTLHSVALPVLARYRVRACCYAVPDYVRQGRSYRDEQPREVMGWSALAEWIAAGHELGSHTQTHAALPACTPERLQQEIAWSQETLEQRLGVAVRHFAYPWGQWTPSCRSALRRSGRYDSLATANRGPMVSGHDPYALRRDRGDLDQSPEQMAALMRLADRLYWLRRLRPRRVKTYCQQHPEVAWDALPQAETARS